MDDAWKAEGRRGFRPGEEQEIRERLGTRLVGARLRALARAAAALHVVARAEIDARADGVTVEERLALLEDAR